MPTIFDNIETPFLENEAGNGLRDALGLALRGDFCVGYFNLRGWRSIDAVVEKWPIGDAPPCRLLVGMHRPPDDELRQLLMHGGDPERLDQRSVVRLKQTMAAEFRRQLTFGVPTDADEAGLRRLARQLRDGPLAGEALPRRTRSTPSSTSLTGRTRSIRSSATSGSAISLSPGLSHQGELNVDVLDHDAGDKARGVVQGSLEGERWCVDITQELIEVIEQSWAREDAVPPHHIYVKIAYHLAQEARADLSEFRIPPDFAACSSITRRPR